VRAHGRPGQPMPAPDLPTYRAQQNSPWPATCTGFAMQKGERAQNRWAIEDPEEAMRNLMEAWRYKAGPRMRRSQRVEKGYPLLMRVGGRARKN